MQACVQEAAGVISEVWCRRMFAKQYVLGVRARSGPRRGGKARAQYNTERFPSHLTLGARRHAGACDDYQQARLVVIMAAVVVVVAVGWRWR